MKMLRSLLAMQVKIESGNNTDNRIKDTIDSAVIVVENRMRNAILTAMNDVVIPRVEMSVRWITGSSGNGHSSIVQNLDRKDFTGITRNTPLRSASSQLDSNIEQDEIDKIRDFDSSEDGDLPATRLDYDRRAHAHHTSKSLCQLGRLNFQSVKTFLRFIHVFFSAWSHHYHTERLKQARERSGRFDELTRFLHLTLSSMRQNWNTVTKFNLAFDWFAISPCLLRSFGDDVRKILIALEGAVQ